VFEIIGFLLALMNCWARVEWEQATRQLKIITIHAESKLLVKQPQKLIALSHFAKVFPLLFDGPKFAKL
jgi:hypothetical protein